MLYNYRQYLQYIYIQNIQYFKRVLAFSVCAINSDIILLSQDKIITPFKGTEAFVQSANQEAVPGSHDGS